MKFILNLNRFIIFFLLTSNTLLSQTINNKVKIIYSYQTPSTNNDSKISNEKYSYLLANSEQSIFISQRNDFPKPENKITQDANTISVRVFNTDEIGSYVFRDFKKESIVFREVGSKFMNAIIVTDKWIEISWKIEEETKKIGEYICKKANCKFRGRNYTAWFTEEIPIPSGPWKLYGLPGLILEVYDSSNEFYAGVKEIKINYESSEEIIPLINNKENKYNYEEYKLYRLNYKEAYVNSLKSKLPRGSNLYIKPSDIKNNPIESEFE